MKFSVLINNYNYGAYLRECVESVLGQTRPADEVIIVDDGSTDDSLDILDKHYGRNPLVKIISQINQGQTAAMARGIENARGDIVCLLDADDHYKPDYLAELEKHYERNPKVDLTFCRFEGFGQEPFHKNEEVVWLGPATDYDYGYTALVTYFGDIYWIGNVTSTLSLRIKLARVLNLREAAEYAYIAHQADFTLLLGASLLGARKFYLCKTLVEYRHHKQGAWLRYRSDKTSVHVRWLIDQARVNYYKRRSCISDSMKWELPDEAATIPKPLSHHLWCYRKAWFLSMIPPFLRYARRRLIKIATPDK